MKRIVFLLFALLCSMNFYAQMWDSSKPDKNLTFGVRAGVNLSTITSGWSPTHAKFNPKTQFHLGLITDIKQSKSFGFETGLMLSMKGAEMDSTTGRSSYDVSIQYMQIPVLAKVKLFLSPETNVQLKAGPYLAFKIGDNSNEICTYKDFNSIDYGVSFGGGLNVKRFFVGAQFDIGLTEFWPGMERKNRCLSISLGYDF